MMKKTLLAIALAAVSTTSMADVILYGNIKGGVEVTKTVGVSGTTTAIADYGSYIGFKGHENLNGNLKAIWQLEQDVDVAGGAYGTNKTQGFGTRDSFVGLASDFGTVKVGYQSTPIKAVNDRLDIWEYGQGGKVAGLGEFTQDSDANTRAVAISYETPNMGGFTATAYVSPSDNNQGNKTDGRDRAIYGVGASYEQPEGGFFADMAGVYVKAGEHNFTNTSARHAPNYDHAYQAIVQAGYEQGNVLVGVAAQRAKNVDVNYDVRNEVAVSGAYKVTPALRLKASAAYGFKLVDQSGAKAYGNGKYLQGVVGADYAFSKRTMVNGQVGYTQFGNKANNNRTGAVSMGMSHKF